MDPITFIIVAILLSVVLTVVSELVRPKPKFESARPAGLGDFQFPTAEEGRVIPIIWGTVRCSGPNVVWYGDFKQKAMTKHVKTGLFSSTKLTTGYKYYLGMQMAVCRGPIDGGGQIWIGDKPIGGRVVPTSIPSGWSVSVNEPKLFGGDELGQGGVVSGICDTFLGSAVQGNSAYLDTFQIPQPGYKGTAYVVLKAAYIGNTTQLQPWAFELSRAVNTLGLGSGLHIVNLVDSNPACVLFEIMTNTEWGRGIPGSKINGASFVVAAQTLFDEGNGWSMIVDSPLEVSALKEEVERQIDGLVYFDHVDGLYHLRLFRNDYDIDDVPELDDSNIVEISSYTRGAWEETSNQVRVSFLDRGKEYKSSYAVASDLANQRIQDGQIITATLNYPGVKNATLAAQIAARQLRYLSVPLAQATLVVDRSLWQVKPGDVVAWTDERLGFSKLPMRVGKVDYGELTDGKIGLSLIQDVFQFAEKFDGGENPSGWEQPTQGVTPLPPEQQLAVEAPYAIIRRDDGVFDRIFAAGRAQGDQAASIKIFERDDPVSTSGPYSEVGEVTGFMVIGALRTAVSAGAAQPTASIEVDASPDDVADIIDALVADASLTDVGQGLTNLIMIEDEFVGVVSRVSHSTWVELTDCYRGLLDSVPKDHDVGAPVYLICAGAGLSNDTVPRGNFVDVKLKPSSRDNEVSDGAATTVSFQMDNRGRRPYAPTELTLNGVRWDDPVSVDAPGPGASTDDDLGITIDFRRRDFRVFDEVENVLSDAAGRVSDFPAAHSEEERAEVTIDPDGTPVSAGFTAWAAAAELFFSRTEILAANAGVVPTRLRVDVGSRHDFDGTTYESRDRLGWSFDVGASELDDDTNMGVLAQNVAGAAYIAPVNGTYAFSVGPVMGTGAVEANVNGGGWNPVITSGNRTGNLAGILIGDSIQVRHTQASTSTNTFLRVDAPGSTADAYAVLQV